MKIVALRGSFNFNNGLPGIARPYGARIAATVM